MPTSYPGHIKWGWCILSKDAVAYQAMQPEIIEVKDPDTGDITTPGQPFKAEVEAQDKQYDCVMQRIDVDATGE